MPCFANPGAAVKVAGQQPIDLQTPSIDQAVGDQFGPTDVPNAPARCDALP